MRSVTLNEHCHKSPCHTTNPETIIKLQDGQIKICGKSIIGYPNKAYTCTWKSEMISCQFNAVLRQNI